MNYVLDTNIISLLLRDHETVTAKFRSSILQGNVFLACPFVLFEVRRGLLERNAQRQLTRLTVFFNGFIWQDFERDDWTLASQLWVQRRTLGRPIDDADLIIAVFALRRNATLVTDNTRDFTDLGVRLENWKSA